MKTWTTTLLTRLLAGVLVVAWNTLPVEAARIFIDPSSQNVAVGQTLTLDIRIADVIDLYAFGFDLGFDPSVLSANDGGSEGAFLLLGGPTLFIPGTIDNTGGTISYISNALNGSVPGVSGSGILATMRFTALASGSSGINLFNPILLDSTFSEPTVSIEPGNVTVTPPTSNNIPEPSTLVLIGIGLAGLELRRRRRANRG